MMKIFINPPALVADECQVMAHASPYPLGFLKIISFYKSMGYQIEYIDMIQFVHCEETDFSNLRVYKRIRCGSTGVRDSFRDVRIFGEPLEYLEKRLDDIRTDVDEFLITSCITYNYPIIWDIIKIIKKRFKSKIKIRLGGFYPTWLPDHAKKSGATIFTGRFEEAEGYEPDYSVYEKLPPIGIFSIIQGCIYRCSFCCNSYPRKVVKRDLRKEIQTIIRLHNKYGFNSFENWDPNVMLDTEHLKKFLKMKKEYCNHIKIGFDYGIQPNKFDSELYSLFCNSNIDGITIPLETSDPFLMRSFKKPYTFDDSLTAIYNLYKRGFLFKRSHFTFLIGYPKDDILSIFKCHVVSTLVGAIPQPFPVTITPKTGDYEKYYSLVKDKDLAELAGNLFPLARSKEEVNLKSKLLKLMTIKDPKIVRKGIACIDKEYAKLYDIAYESVISKMKGLGFTY